MSIPGPVTLSLEKQTMMRGGELYRCQGERHQLDANTIDTTAMMEAAMPDRMTWTTCGSACEGNRTVDAQVLADENSSSKHDRNAPAQQVSAR